MISNTISLKVSGGKRMPHCERSPLIELNSPSNKSYEILSVASISSILRLKIWFSHSTNTCRLPQ